MTQSEAIKAVHAFTAGSYQLGLVGFYNEQTPNVWSEILEEYEKYLIENREDILEFQVQKIVKKMDVAIKYFLYNNQSKFVLNPQEGMFMNPNGDSIDKQLSVKGKFCYRFCGSVGKKLNIVVDKNNPNLLYLVCNDCKKQGY